MRVYSYNLSFVTLTMVFSGIFLISTVSQEVNSTSQNSTKVYKDINSTDKAELVDDGSISIVVSSWNISK